MVLNLLILPKNTDKNFESKRKFDDFIGKEFCLVKYFSLENISSNLDLKKNDVIERVKKLPFFDSLFLLSRIDLYLGLLSPNNTNVQTDLIDLLFSIDTKKLIKNELNYQGDNSIIFHRQQIYYLISLIINHSNTKKIIGISSELSNEIGILLLFVNSLINKDSNNDKKKYPKLYSLDGKDLFNPHKMTGLIWKSIHFNLSTSIDWTLELSRAHIIYNDIEEGRIFSRAFFDKTGIEINNLLITLLLFISKFTNNSDNLIPLNGMLHFQEYFSNTSNNISIDVYYKILNLFSDNSYSLKEKYQTSLKHFENPEVNFEFLYEKPIIEVEKGMFICLSIPYLIKRGLFDILEIFRNKLDKNDFIIISSGLRSAYEGYIKALMKKGFPKLENDLYPKIHFKKSGSTQIGDALIDYGDKIVIIEIKAQKIEKKIKLSSNIGDIKRGLEKFLTKKGAKQLDKRIREFKEGKIKIEGIDPKKIKNYYPILISCIEELPQHLYISEYYQELLKSENLLQDFDIKPLTILNIKETEFIMELIEEKRLNLCDLIDEKIKKDFHISFWNFLVKNYNLIYPKILHNKLESFIYSAIKKIKP